MDSTVTRRTALTAGAVGVGVLAVGGVAACSSSSRSTAGGGGGRGDSAGGIVALAKVPVGEAVSADIDGNPAIVAQPTAGTAVAFSAVCTHMGCTVAPAGKELHCPCHGSVYDATTGQVLSGPAPKPLPKIAVQVVNGEVVKG
jgi:Rieske Fe-S protein